jgi:phosphatidylglycerophosphate synthase
MPDVGLYQAKHGLRRVLNVVPGIEHLSPNAVSLSSLVPSALAAFGLWQGLPGWVVIGIVGRMLLTTLDGLIAEGYGKKTRVGGYINRIVAEVGDVALFLALAMVVDVPWGALVLGLAWLVNVFGVLGLVSQGSIQPVGPAGQTDRVAFVALYATVTLFTPLSWTPLAQLLVAAMLVTLALRTYRSVRELTAQPIG